MLIYYPFSLRLAEKIKKTSFQGSRQKYYAPAKNITLSQIILQLLPNNMLHIDTNVSSPPWITSPPK